MLPIIFLLGVMQTQLLELQAEIKPNVAYATEVPKVLTTKRIEPNKARYKYRPVTDKTVFLDKVEWKRQLRKCESGGVDKALNPKDLDGTESIGRYQFKKGTFYGFAKKYNISVTDVWNGEEQEKILDKMIEDEKVDLTFQFPDCTTRIGLPISEKSE
jgi:hypothetical protein